MAIKRIKPLGFPWQTQDPFLFCVHHLDFYPEGNEKLGPKASLQGRSIGNDFRVKDGWRMYHGSEVPGFPVHPHRGFETVTIARQGYIDHSDSLGAAARFGKGDVQWMTAGKGIQHSEMFPLLNQEGENTLELFQVWLNLPQKSKMTEPYFRMLWHEEIPVLSLGGAELTLIAGKYEDKQAPAPTPDSWAADAENQVCIWLIRLEPEAEYILPASEAGLTRSLFFFEGEKASFGDSELDSEHALELDSDKELKIKNGKKASEFLLLQGKPINEPVAQQGPFVMNYPGEIRQAVLDYQKTRFGGWPWENYEPVHERESGRFAKFADGTTEKP